MWVIDHLCLHVNVNLGIAHGRVTLENIVFKCKKWCTISNCHFLSNCFMFKSHSDKFGSSLQSSI